MTRRKRILDVLEGRKPDHVPLTTWCFGFPASEHLKWSTNGKSVDYGYTMRREHLHNLPPPWTLDDEFKRAEAWLSLGIDDALEVSVPWSQSPEVTRTDSVIPVGSVGGDAKYPVMVREYQTPDERIRV